jgi:hypothetical protein
MPDFDSFDALRSDPKKQALEVTLTIGGESVTLPWKADGQAAATLRDRHDIEIGEVLSQIQDVSGSTLSEEVLEEHGVTSREDFEALPEEEKQAIIDASEAGESDAGRMIEALAGLLHAGFVRFEPGLERETVLSAVGFPALAEAPIEEMVGRLSPSRDETAPEASGEAGGKA